VGGAALGVTQTIINKREDCPELVDILSLVDKRSPGFYRFLCYFTGSYVNFTGSYVNFTGSYVKECPGMLYFCFGQTLF